MEYLFDTLRSSSTTVQALAVTVGGLVGVFATLGFFFILIWLAGKAGGKNGR